MTQIIVFFLLLIVCAAAYVLKLQLEIKQLRLLLTTQETIPTPAPLQTDVINEPLPNAGAALKKPPTTIQATIAALKNKPDPLYRFPLGWVATVSQGVFLQTARFVGDVNHILISGQSDAGKDNAALNMLLALALTHTPQQVQFAIVDGKGLDWIGWQDKAHTWHLATDPEHIGAAMQRLTAERQRRREILAAAKVSKWDLYRGTDLPLLVVFVSELLLLENAVGSKNLTSWLNTELTAARAFGIRYVIATQNASNFSTQWRSQISLFMAGFQPLDSSDAPNTTMSAKELTERGLVAPSKLPSPSNGAGGVFVLVQSGNGINVRTSLISDEHRDYCLQRLPDATRKPLQRSTQPDDQVLVNLLNDDYILVEDWDEEQHLVLQNSVEQNRASDKDKSSVLQESSTRRTTSISPSSELISSSYVELPFSDDKVPFAEQKRIIEAAATVNSKRQLCLKLYDTDGGQKSTWVKLVCDALGLLQNGSSAVGK